MLWVHFALSTQHVVVNGDYTLDILAILKFQNVLYKIY